MPDADDPRGSDFDDPAVLRIDLETPLDLRDLTDAFDQFATAYSSLYVFLGRIDRAFRLAREENQDGLIWGLRDAEFGLPMSPSKSELRRASKRSGVPSARRLQLVRVRAESPGFADLAGASGPLESLRKYRVDRDERRKDREWREDLERERMELDNELAKLEVQSGQSKVIRERYEYLKEVLGVDEARRIAVADLMKAGRTLDGLNMATQPSLMPASDFDGDGDDGHDDSADDERGRGEPGDEGGGGEDDKDSGDAGGDGDGDAEEPDDEDIEAGDEIVDAYAPRHSDAGEYVPA